MKRCVQAMIALVALAMSATPRAEEPARHVVMISIDGLRPVFYTQPGPAKIPTIRRVMQQGAWRPGTASSTTALSILKARRTWRGTGTRATSA